eukprot:INCI13218.1.p1 GENE.INCI13218.1~~INCI13218.1.p1  ORF type:complete len:625 (+),score=113.73 INCI13218.1:96-1877(+)
MATPQIVVLGASGTVGTATVKALSALGIQAIAGVRNPDTSAAKNAGLVEAGAKLVAADMGNPETLAAVLSEGSRVLVVTPGHEDRTQLALNAVKAAKDAKASLVALISVCSVASTGLFAEQFRPIENAVANSGIPFLILRLPMFMDNVLGQPIKDASGIFLPIDASIPYSSVTVSDIGEASANALAYPARFVNRTLNVSGVITTAAETAKAFSEVLSKRVNFVKVDEKAAFESLHAGGKGMPEWQTRGVLQLFALISAVDRSQVMPAGDNHTTELLGRAPTTVKEFAQSVKAYVSDPSPTTVIVLGSTGSIGSSTIAALTSNKFKGRVNVLAGVRDPDPKRDNNAKLVKAGATLVHADMGKPETLTAAIPEGSTVLIVTPGAENRRQLATNAILAAAKVKAAHIGLISFTSVESTGLFARQIRPVENALAASGVSFTTFRLTFFLDNMLGQPIKDQGKIYQPHAAKAKYNLLPTSEAGEAIARGLLNPHRFRNRTLSVGGIQTSGAEVAAAFAKALGKKVEYTQVPIQATREALLSKGMPEWQVGGAIELLELQMAGDKTQVLPSGDNHMRELLGRNPTSVQDWAESMKFFFQ